MPRLVDETEAAKTVGIPVATFRAWVEAGRLPRPLPDCGLYEVKALDAAVDQISGLGGAGNALDSWRISKGAARNAR